MNEQAQSDASFDVVVAQLVSEIESLRASIGPLMVSGDLSTRWAAFRLNRFLAKKGVLVEHDEETSSTYQVEAKHFQELQRLDTALKNACVAQSLLPESLLVTLVSRFDAYLGCLIKVMVANRPELLLSSEKTLTLGRLIQLGNYEIAREYLIEKEIESVLRSSHSDQFGWLENKLSIPLRKDLPCWQRFIEITERRNLFVHCAGVVSHQYLANCADHKVQVPPEVMVGSRLDVSPTYYRSACDCLLEIGVKLGHVIWRKLLPDDREAADDSLNNTCYDLILKGNYGLAVILLEFTIFVLKKYASERHRLMFVMNLAQAYKWSGEPDKCMDLLTKEDWSAKGDDFRLCVAVLRENHGQVASLMRSMGPNGSVQEDAYRNWPIFREARKREEFQQAFVEVFGHELSMREQSSPIKEQEVQDFLKDLVKLSPKHNRLGAPSIEESEERASDGQRQVTHKGNGEGRESDDADE